MAVGLAAVGRAVGRQGSATWPTGIRPLIEPYTVDHLSDTLNSRSQTLNPKPSLYTLNLGP